MAGGELSREEWAAFNDFFGKTDKEAIICDQASEALTGVLSKAEACLSFHSVALSACGKRAPFALVIGNDRVRAAREYAWEGYGFFHWVNPSNHSRYRDTLFRAVTLGDGNAAVRALFVSSNEEVSSRSQGATVIPVELSASCLHGDALRDAYVVLEKRGDACASSQEPTRLALNDVAVGALQKISLRFVRFGVLAS